jgi:hypothetical protein
MTNISLKKFKLRNLTIIQISIATVISLIFQFIIPFSWQPLDTFLYGVRAHGDPDTNLVIFTISQWYFSISLTWFIYPDNPYINNFLIYSIAPLGILILYEFFFLFFYYDYIHITPLLIDIYLIWRKRETLLKNFAPIIIILNSLWLYSVYLLKLAYYSEDVLIFTRNVLIYIVIWIILSFLFDSKRKNEIDN